LEVRKERLNEREGGPSQRDELSASRELWRGRYIYNWIERDATKLA
jgi:hypothetical protein